MFFAAHSTGPYSGVPDHEQCWADADSEFSVPGEALPRRHMCMDRGTTSLGLCPHHHAEILGVIQADTPQPVPAGV